MCVASYPPTIIAQIRPILTQLFVYFHIQTTFLLTCAVAVMSVSVFLCWTCWSADSACRENIKNMSLVLFLAKMCVIHASVHFTGYTMCLYPACFVENIVLMSRTNLFLLLFTSVGPTRRSVMIRREVWDFFWHFYCAHCYEKFPFWENSSSVIEKGMTFTTRLSIITVDQSVNVLKF